MRAFIAQRLNTRLSRRGFIRGVLPAGFGLLCVLILGLPRAWANDGRVSDSTYAVKIEYNVMVPMRDGIRLSTDIYRPEAEGPFPALITRDPYGNGSDSSSVATSRWFASHGYVVLHQDVRGRYDSEGSWYPYLNEITDGYDIQQWAGTQPWSNGKVGMFGASYLAAVQWLSARLRNPYLKTIAPAVTPFNYYDDVAYVGHALSLASRMGWAIGIGGRTGQDVPADWTDKLRALPLMTLDRVFGMNLPHWQDWIRHPSYDPYWQVLNSEAYIPEMDVGVLTIGGWHDIFLKGTLASYTGMVKKARTPTARRGQKLILGPWPHGYNVRKTGDIDYGPDAVIDVRALRLRWMDYWLKGLNNGILDEPPVRIFVMGDNRWRDEQEWPLARTQYTRYYFHSQGKASTLDGDGTLNLQPPRQEPSDTYVYDPNDPVPTRGGNNMTITPGAFDQREVERRADVLVFTSAPLAADLEVTGPLAVTLYAASSATDTDFTAKLVDVYPDGRTYNVADGIIRARYRESSTDPTLIEPGKVYPYTIDLWATSTVFKQGHRIRVDISSSNFPRFDRNPNTGHPFGLDAELMTATQTIYHDSRYPSHIVLPVIPR